MPHLEDCTPYSNDHAACWDWQDAGAISARPRTISMTTVTSDAMPHSVLSTMFDHCTSTIWGKTATSVFPYSCIPPLLVSIKGGGGHPLKRSVDSLDIYRSEHTHLLLASDIVIRHAQTPLLAETWEPPSLSRLACTPYYKHSGCKIIQCTCTPPLLDVWPRGRNQDKPMRYCVASCITI